MRVSYPALVVGVLAVSAASQAAVDNLVNLLTPAQAVGGGTVSSPLGAYGYDASTGEFYAIGFNGTAQDLRRVNNGAVTRLITNAPIQTFTRGGDPNNGGGVPTPSGLSLNPKPILNTDGTVAIPAYGTAVIADAAGIVTAGGVANRSLSRRVYRADVFRFKLPDTDSRYLSNATTASGQALVPLVSTADMIAASGYAGTSNSTNTGRQVAFSGDGQSVYFADTSDSVGGLYKASVLTGALIKISGDSIDNNTEPAVRTADGVDSVFLRGGGSTGNLNGIDLINTATGVRSIAVANSRLTAFAENTLSNIISMTSDADGNLYFGNTNATAGAGGGIYRLDTQGRLIKVVSYSERKTFNAGPPLNVTSFNAGQLRMQQVGGTAYTGPNGAFSVPTLAYAESSAVNAVNGVLLFKPVDVNRDNSVNVTDLQLLGSKLTVRGVKQTNSDLFRFDLNGNDAVDYGDIKTAQQFLNFSDGDANLDLSLNYDDLNVLRDNYNGPADKTWVLGDLNGNNTTTFSDLVQVATNWLAVMPRPTAAELDGRYTGFYRSEVDRAFDAAVVPEPATLGLIAAFGGLTLRRRRNNNG